ncbi:L-seryl-tRNA(Sec) selenium transferase [Frankliniella fusca]|uniref:L-seryl-tRNA(Sec) selenium transferase n=1 Tax=Frankliniella fusca TaxID=407009 RepID=A0AAE1LQ18_9NEOP|nr:L-seryl-tRNA(Sec) selenium transferase [Frankliniella fusca]KAK3910966.1 L-seryl-tRNA(Sec) selenium transferase [Frankliniella fusca]KAK3911912.1 L-seryl-tRNA(Sec) selenium transferase [Frankliniella fusca]KAK3928401.1 L-seryl-tRNA(Sec) selenium transferase [Frankliniella fusca]
MAWFRRNCLKVSWVKMPSDALTECISIRREWMSSKKLSRQFRLSNLQPTISKMLFFYLNFLSSKH